MPRGIKITEEEYQQIKSVADLFPKGKKGLAPVYAALGVSSQTANRIRRSDNYEAYIKAQNQHYAPVKKVGLVENTKPVETHDTAAHNRINHLEAVIEGMDERLVWLTDNAVIGSSKRKWPLR